MIMLFRESGSWLMWSGSK